MKLVIGDRFNKDCGRGRISLSNILISIMQLEEDSDASRSAILNLASASTSAVEVQSSRVALPKVAGVCDPTQLAHQCEAEMLNNSDQLVIEDIKPQAVPKPCLMVDKVQESLLRHRMVESGMAVLIPEDKVPLGPNGRKLLAGLLAVGHKRRQRPPDRRPQASKCLRDATHMG